MFTDLPRARPGDPAATPPARTPAARPPAPDPAFAALPRLVRLRDALRAALPPATRSPVWAEPPVFFFDPARQAEYEAAHPRPVPAADPVADAVAAELPALFRSVDVRRAARAVPGLREAATALAAHSPAAKELADLLAVPDDDVVLVLHPARRAGFRFRVRGIVDVAQFHLLLLDAVTGEPADGWLPGPPPPARFREVCSDADPVVPAGVPMVAEARYQFFKPSALQADGTVPGGFRGCDHWLWGHDPLAVVPRMDGERVVLLGEPAVPTTWEVERRFPAMPAEARLLRVLGPFEVAERLTRLVGHPLPAPTAERPALARAA